MHPQCVGWALSCCNWDPVDADDVVQTSYLKILDGRARFDGRAAFRTWVFGVIRRTAAELRRRRALSRLRLLAWRNGSPDGGDRVPGADVALALSERVRELTRALQQLPRRQREVIHLVFYEDLSIREAADVLGITVGSARQHYERGKAGLRRALKEQG